MWEGRGETNINRKLQGIASSLFVNYAPNKSVLYFDAVYILFPRIYVNSKNVYTKAAISNLVIK